MNLRKSKLAEEILEGLVNVEIGSGLLLIYLPNGLDSLTTRNIGESIESALKALGKTNPILLMPKDITLKEVPETDMKELGWIKDPSLKEKKEPVYVETKNGNYYFTLPFTTSSTTTVTLSGTVTDGNWSYLVT